MKEFDKQVDVLVVGTGCGGLPAALGDFDFLVASGGLKGPASNLNPDNFWNFELLEKAKSALN